MGLDSEEKLRRKRQVKQASANARKFLEHELKGTGKRIAGIPKRGVTSLNMGHVHKYNISTKGNGTTVGSDHIHKIHK